MFTLSLLLFFVLLPFLLSQPPRRGRSRDRDFLLPLRTRSRRECSLRFRTLTGECTSRSMPSFGEARLPQFSYLSTSSISPSGQSLKSAREISNIVFSQPSSIPNSRGVNQLFVFFGQFLDHNFAATPEEEGDHFDITVPADDPSLDEDVLSFSRSTRGEVEGGGERPINTLSSAVDLVAVYGPNELRNEELRERDSQGEWTGRLKTGEDDLMPRNDKGFANAPDETGMFFMAGDHRANEHPVLTAFHTIFLREHNRLVEKVKEEYNDLNGEKVYELARAMNVAQLQKVVFEEFYPAIVGERLPKYMGHKKKVDVTLSDIFAGAAFRIGHTMVGERIPKINADGVKGEEALEDTFFRTADKFNDALLDDVIRGVGATFAEEVDGMVVNTLRNGLFQFVPGVEGFDLVALNIQRGRDHALPSFQQIRSIFGLSDLNGFDDITGDPDMQMGLDVAYNGMVDDVEAFPGLLTEDHVDGASMGETMREVWRAEFQRLRDGDQFYYLNPGALPSKVVTGFPKFVKNLGDRKKPLLRKIIVRNTGIEKEELPKIIFFV